MSKEKAIFILNGICEDAEVKQVQDKFYINYKYDKGVNNSCIVNSMNDTIRKIKTYLKGVKAFYVIDDIMNYEKIAYIQVKF